MINNMLFLLLLVCSTLVVAHYGNIDTNNCHEENGVTHCHTDSGSTYYFDTKPKKNVAREPSSIDAHEAIEKSCDEQKGEKCEEKK